MVTASLVKELREKTGAGMMDCKKVLTETNGDMEKAIELLRERGIAKAAKKSGRVAAEGLVEAYVSEDGKIGAVVEVNSETDFVAKNEEFKNFVMNVAKQVVEKNPATVEELLAQDSIEVPGKTVNEVLVDKIATIGENMNIRRFERFESEGLVEKYIHGDGKIAVLVNMKSGDKDTVAKTKSIMKSEGFDSLKDISTNVFSEKKGTQIIKNLYSIMMEYKMKENQQEFQNKKQQEEREINQKLQTQKVQNDYSYTAKELPNGEIDITSDLNLDDDMEL